MSAAALLERLQRVHQAAPDRWRAVCPAHENKRGTQSLAIRELGDGTVLVKCFAGCGAADICEKAGLEMAELFPPRHRAPCDPRRAQRPNHWPALREAVLTLKRECLVVAIAAEDIAAGREITKTDAERCIQSAIRIRDALETCA